ncbi:MAG: restriction endonuclease subunit S [Chryseobacterium sp.]|nr:restriction endonuclease subunit S [Chryseobacterium sp.]
MGEIGEVKMCRRIFNNETTQTGDIPFFKIGSFGKDADAFISKELYSDYKKRFSFPKKGDILISAAGTIGRTVVYNGEDAYFQDSNIVWIDNDNTKITNEFLYYILQIVKYNTEGGTIQRLYNNILKSTKFSSPLIEEQQKIASFLSLIEERIQTQIKIIEELKLLKNTLSKKIFSRQLRFKDDNGNDFPEWQHKKLGELATITTGSSNREDSILDGEYTFFDRSQDVRTSKRYLFNKEAVIVPGEGQKFTPKYFMGKFDLHQRTYAIFDFIELSGKYLYYHIDIDEKYLQSQAVGSTVKSLRLPMFQSMPIKLPPLEEQMKIANFLLSIDTKIDVETELLEKLEKQKKYLLQNLFI